MTVSGKIKIKGELQKVTEKFVKQEIVITTEEQYPQVIQVQFTQDKTDLLHPFKVGDDVNIDVNLRGREWVSPQGETKYFTSVEGWRIQNAQR